MRKVVLYGVGGFVGVCVLLAILGVIGNAIKGKTGGTSANEGAATVAVSRCRPASPALVERLQAGLKPGVQLGAVNVVKSNDFEKVWFAAGQITGTGIPAKTIGLWAVNDLSGGGLTYSINGTAQAFSTWGKGSDTAAKIRANDDGAKEAIDCAR